MYLRDRIEEYVAARGKTKRRLLEIVRAQLGEEQRAFNEAILALERHADGLEEVRRRVSAGYPIELAMFNELAARDIARRLRELKSHFFREPCPPTTHSTPDEHPV